MPIGIITNVGAVLVGGVLGCLIGNRVSEQWKTTLTGFFGLAALTMGVVLILRVKNLVAGDPGPHRGRHRGGGAAAGAAGQRPGGQGDPQTHGWHGGRRSLFDAGGHGHRPLLLQRHWLVRGPLRGHDRRRQHPYHQSHSGRGHGLHLRGAPGQDRPLAGRAPAPDHAGPLFPVPLSRPTSPRP